MGEDYASVSFFHILYDLKTKVDLQANIRPITGVGLGCNSRAKDISLPSPCPIIFHTTSIMNCTMSNQALACGENWRCRGLINKMEGLR